ICDGFRRRGGWWLMFDVAASPRAISFQLTAFSFQLSAFSFQLSASERALALSMGDETARVHAGQKPGGRPEGLTPQPGIRCLGRFSPARQATQNDGLSYGGVKGGYA